MAQITEDYVSFEIAKLLREKGFDAECNYCYSVPVVEQGYVLNMFFRPVKNFELIDDVYTAPTLQMAMKWLREVHNIHITGVPNGIGENVFYMGIYRKYYYGWTCISDCLDEKYKEAEFHTPEEACEAAIKYCLENLI